MNEFARYIYIYVGPLRNKMRWELNKAQDSLSVDFLAYSMQAKFIYATRHFWRVFKGESGAMF